MRNQGFCAAQYPQFLWSTEAEVSRLPFHAPSAIVKQNTRYTDFLVNEILLDGSVLHLNSLGKARNNKNKSGNVIDRSPSPEPKPNAEPLVPPQPSSSASIDATISEQDLADLTSLLGVETTKNLQELYTAILRDPKRKPASHPTHRSEQIQSKDQRTQVHQVVRRVFQSRIDTLTQDDGYIELSASRKKPYHATSNYSTASHRPDAFGQRGPNKLGWESNGGEWLHFTLHKENKDTMEVLGFLANQTKMHTKRFAFAGTKDRRSVSIQRCCVYRMDAGQLRYIGRRLKGAVIADFERSPKELKLGDLSGNEFGITLRDASPINVNGAEQSSLENVLDRKAQLEDILKVAVPALEQHGFLNYYGLQRFGSFAIPTHIIGMKMLQGDLKGAVDDILSFSPGALGDEESQEGTGHGSKVSRDDRARAQAINQWRIRSSETSANREQNDSEANPTRSADEKGPVDACKRRDRNRPSSPQIPSRFNAEAQLMRHLSSRNRAQHRDYQGALMTLPRNLRLMYVHAYQSFVWNAMVSQRWKIFGPRVVEGDLIIIDNSNNGDRAMNEVDENGETIVNPAEGDTAAQKDDYTRARPLTAEEVGTGAHSIFDVVLPLPGYDVEYPPNAMGEAYREFMASEEGGRLDCNDMRRSWKDASLSGGYRKIVARPLRGIAWEVRRYAGEEDQLVETDLEMLRKNERRAKGEEVVIRREESEGDAGAEMGAGVGAEADAEASMGAAGVLKEASEGGSEGQRLAVILKLRLGASTYATMALRELMGDGGCIEWKPDFGGGRKG